MGTYLRSAFWNPDIAIDLGTAVTRISSATRNLFAVPSMVGGRNVLRSGFIREIDPATKLLQPLLSKVRKFGIVRPHVVTCVPSDATAAERDVLRECILRAGAATVVIVPEPLAAAIGAGMDVSSPYAGMIVDMGEGVTDCAVIRSGKIVEHRARRVGCCDLRHQLVNTAPCLMEMQISEVEAERIMREAGVARKSPATGQVTAYGRSVRGASSSATSIPVQEIQEKLEPIIDVMLGVVQGLLHDLPPAVGCEIIENGIFLSGGGALLRGMRERLEERTQLCVFTPAKPLEAVVAGAREMLPVVSLLNYRIH